MVSRVLVAVLLVSLVGTPPATAQVGRANPELARWYEQAQTYYTAVVSGAEARPDADEWNEFLNQMDWASEQLGSESGWDPYGGSPGPEGNLVYNAERVRIGFVGDGTSDIWSDDVTLEVASTSATVTVERTTDTRSKPPEEIIKIVVTDPATGTEAVYFIHDAEDAKITINAPSSAQVTDPTDIVRIGVLRARKPGPPPRRRRP